MEEAQTTHEPAYDGSCYLRPARGVNTEPNGSAREDRRTKDIIF